MNTPNEWADFWRNEIGVNVIPAVGKLKIPKFPWLKDPRGNWQVDPIPIEIHNAWKDKGLFDEGMAVICGKVLHRKDRKHLYLCAVDMDNLMAIKAITPEKGLEELAKKTIVEQHANPNTAHLYVYTTKPMWKKSSDSTNSKIKEKMDNNEIPAIEMKGEGSHGIMYCSPSPHKDGSSYQIIGTLEPCILDDIGDVVKGICDKWNLGIGNDGGLDKKVLMDKETKVVAGHNRHEAIMVYGEVLLRRYPNMYDDEFEDMMRLKNERMCDPPLNEEELQKQIKCAVDFIAEKIAEENELKKKNKTIFGTEEFWYDVKLHKQAFHPSGKYIKCLDCKGLLIEPNAFEKEHYGHRVTFIKN